MHKAQCIVSAVHSATGPPAGRTGKARHGNVLASHCLHAVEMSLATTGYSLHCHLRFITTLAVMHLNPSDQLSVALVFDSRRLFTSVLLSQWWSSLYFFLFLTSSTEILNRCFKKALTKTKARGLFKRHPLWFSSAVILGSGDVNSSSVITTES